ncbi:hypothetical protein GMA3_73 [Gordonia phage GMA3]|uniref:Uncharacterized protein n=1 Tax=Gordonia phage GMA3 TaxID=1647284 RepID=A0A0K0NKL8_9CAUD|nr:hypothetical protein AU105_gp073 [Gordonia phage GMA3]AKL88250.1 hypothetical protein GMA3_73 [Gordonia phage GMA3]
MTDTGVDAIRALLGDLDAKIASLSAENRKLEESAKAANLSRLEAEGELRKLQENLADSEPRVGVEYMTAMQFVSKKIGQRNTALSKSIGMRAVKIGKDRGVLPVKVSDFQQNAINAWPIDIWEMAYKSHLESEKY